MRHRIPTWQVCHFLLSYPSNTCFQEYSIKIYNVNTVVNPIADVTACDSYTLPPIVGPGHYWTAAGGPFGTGSQLMSPYIVNTSRTLYVYAEDNNRVACSDEDVFTVTIVKSPDLNPIMAVSVFDSYTIPPYNDPMFTFTATNPGVVTNFIKTQVDQRAIQWLQMFIRLVKLLQIPVLALLW